MLVNRLPRDGMRSPGFDQTGSARAKSDAVPFEEGIRFLHGDCLELMPLLPDRSVDMVLCDLSYGITDCPWDVPLPLAELWRHYARLMRPGGAVVLTATHPFTTDMIASNRRQFRYGWAWEKNVPTGFANAKRRTLKLFEDVLVFCDRAPPYYPQGLRTLDRPIVRGDAPREESVLNRHGFLASYVQESTGYLVNVLRFPGERGLHPTQKLVALCSSTWSAPTPGRRCVGIEKDAAYCEVARRRITSAQLPLFAA